MSSGKGHKVRSGEQIALSEGKELTQLRRVQRTPHLTHKAPIKPTPFERPSGRITLVQHPAVQITRVEDGFQLGRDRVGRAGVGVADQAKDVGHVFAEEGEGHFRIERVDGGREGLPAPDGRDERFTCGCESPASTNLESRKRKRQGQGDSR